MKKIITLIFITYLSFMFVNGEDLGNKKFFIEVNGNFLFPGDSGYKDVYGSSLFYPGFEAGFKVVKDIYIFAGYGMIKDTGTTPVLGEEAKSSQNMISFGVGYSGEFSDKFGYRIGIGGVSFSYKEEALGEEVSGSKIGFLLKGGVFYNLGETFFISTSLGYSFASDTVNGVDIKLGGLQVLIGLGARF